MNTDEERSFIARLTCDGSAITFLQEFKPHKLFNREPMLEQILTAQSDYRPPVLVLDPSTNKMVRVGYTIRTKNTVVVHFECYDDYYNMKILSAPYYQQYISRNDEGCLLALPPAGGNTASFNLLDADHNIITLDDFSSDTSTVYLKARHAGIIRKQINGGTDNYTHRYSTFTDRAGDIVKFQLNILERHTVSPRLSTPYP